MMLDPYLAHFLCIPEPVDGRLKFYRFVRRGKKVNSSLANVSVISTFSVRPSRPPPPRVQIAPPFALRLNS